MKNSLLVYRVLANIVGVLLMLLTIGVVLKYGFEKPGLADSVAFFHGMFYIAYVFSVFELARRMAIPFKKMVVMFLAGVIPFATFVIERRITKELSDQIASV